MGVGRGGVPAWSDACAGQAGSSPHIESVAEPFVAGQRGCPHSAGVASAERGAAGGAGAPKASGHVVLPASRPHAGAVLAAGFFQYPDAFAECGGDADAVPADVAGYTE